MKKHKRRLIKAIEARRSLVKRIMAMKQEGKTTFDGGDIDKVIERFNNPIIDWEIDLNTLRLTQMYFIIDKLYKKGWRGLSPESFIKIIKHKETLRTQLANRIKAKQICDLLAEKN